MSEKYRPINCEFHDELESASTLNKEVAIVFLDDTGAQKEIRSIIVDLGIRVVDGTEAEYMFMKSGLRIRLDRIISIDGIVRPNS